MDVPKTDQQHLNYLKPQQERDQMKQSHKIGFLLNRIKNAFTNKVCQLLLIV